jgi:DNA-binding IclR family transcriptional regulator
VVATRGTGLRRGLEILRALGTEEALAQGGFGVTELAARTGHEKSQVSRALAVLAEFGLAERAAGTSAYRLGWECFALATRAGVPRLVEEATPALAHLVAEVEEAAHLSVLRGAEVLTVLTHVPARAVVARSWVGRTIPAYCTSSGRALLADHDLDALVELLGPGAFPARTVNAPRDADELSKRIERDRDRGYAVAEEESELGLVGVAAPVRDFTGRVIAAVNVSAPKFRVEGRQPLIGDRVHAVAEKLSAALGSQLGAVDRARGREESKFDGAPVAPIRSRDSVGRTGASAPVETTPR